MFKTLCLALLTGALFLPSTTAKRADVRSVAAAGHIKNKEYQNSYFGVRVQLPQPATNLELNKLVAENRVILLLATNEKGGPDQRYTFTIVAHSDDIPGLEDTPQFVRSVRHQLEREGYQTLVAEARVVIGGHEFIQSDLKMQNRNYWKSVLATRIKGYMFGFWMEAPAKQQMEKLTNLQGRVIFDDSPTAPTASAR
jgi:hypothetical protein